VKVTDLSKEFFFDIEFDIVDKTSLFSIVVKFMKFCFDKIIVFSELLCFSEDLSLLFKLELLIFFKIFESDLLNILSKSFMFFIILISRTSSSPDFNSIGRS